MAEEANDDALMATSLPSLLRVTGCRTLRDVAVHVEDRVGLDVECWISGLGPGASEGVEIRIGKRGSWNGYPFELNELYTDALILEEVYWFDVACESLADEIAIVEGFPVMVTIDYSCDERTVRSSAGRRELVLGDVIQTVPEYPYVKAMSGSRTFEEWKSKRFDRHFAGLDVWYTDPNRRASVAQTTLGELRRREVESADTRAPNPGERRCAQCGTPAVPIAYGFPRPTIWEAAERGEIVLGGCDLPVDGAPTHSCSCGALTATMVDE